MPLFIERMTSEVVVADAEPTLTPEQTEKLASIVIAKLEARARQARSSHAATKLTRHAAKPLDVGE